MIRSAVAREMSHLLQMKLLDGMRSLGFRVLMYCSSSCLTVLRFLMCPRSLFGLPGTPRETAGSTQNRQI